MPQELTHPRAIQTHQEELDFLEKIGFNTNPLNFRADSLEHIWQHFEQLGKDRDNLPYQIDGLVVKLDNLELVEGLGVVGKTPRGWCALKFQAEELTTKIVGITWQVGRTGKVTPVAELEPVELDGTTVKRATLHNYKEVLEYQLCPQDTVIIRKAGDIIPEVVTILVNLRLSEAKPFSLPTSCPSCNAKLSLTSTEVDLMCSNAAHCPAQILGRLSYYTKRNVANITGLSEKNIQKFVEKFGIKDIPDLYNLPYQEIFEMESFGQKSVENLKDSVEKARTVKDFRFLAGLSIEGVGPEVAKLICEKLNEQEELT